MRRKISLFFLGALVFNLAFMIAVFNPVWRTPFDAVQISFGTTTVRYLPGLPVYHFSDGKFGSDTNDETQTLYFNHQKIDKPAETIATTSVISPGTPHGPIDILGDDIFHLTAAAESWQGNGNATHPYIIENFDINVNSAPYHGISISSTSLHFIIRGCTIQRANLTGYAGIYLENVLNGELSNNNCTQNDLAGIYLIGDMVDPTHCPITDNICNGNGGPGIYLISDDAWDGLSVTGNTCTGNGGAGISVAGDGVPGIITDNTCTGNGGAGISAIGPDGGDIMISANTCNGNGGAGISASAPAGGGAGISANTCNGNGGAGIHASLMIGTVPVPDTPLIWDNTCDNNDGPGIRSTVMIDTVPLPESPLISQNTCTNNGGAGIHSTVMIDTVPLPESPLISQNTCDNNDGDGIYSRFMIGTWPTPEMPLLTENTCTNNGRTGITVHNSEVTPSPVFTPSERLDKLGFGTTKQTDGILTITQNTCSDNTGHGLYLSNASLALTVSWNTFADNGGNNVMDDGVDNIFTGNYYSDYTGSDSDNDGFGDTPYSIPGTAGNEDPIPLMQPHDVPLPPRIPGFPLLAVAMGVALALGIGLLTRHRRHR